MVLPPLSWLYDAVTGKPYKDGVSHADMVLRARILVAELLLFALALLGHIYFSEKDYVAHVTLVILLFGVVPYALKRDNPDLAVYIYGSLSVGMTLYYVGLQYGFSKFNSSAISGVGIFLSPMLGSDNMITSMTYIVGLQFLGLSAIFFLVEEPPVLDPIQEATEIGYTTGCILVISALTMAADEYLRRRRLSQLQTAKRATEEATHFRQMFLATMSHEILNPLSGILDSIEILMDDPTSDVETLALALTCGVTLHRRLTQILRIAELDNGNKTVQNAPLLLPVLLDQLYEAVIGKAEEKNLTLDFHLIGSAPLLRMDNDKLTTALLVLVDNAIKYNVYGGLVEVVCVALPHHSQANRECPPSSPPPPALSTGPPAPSNSLPPPRQVVPVHSPLFALLSQLVKEPNALLPSSLMNVEYWSSVVGHDADATVGGHESQSELFSVEFFVLDTGVGAVPDENGRFQYLLESFHVVDGKDRQGYSNAPLSLAQASVNVKVMGGELGLVGRQNQGTVAFFSVPNVEREPMPAFTSEM